jgi:hypothetical protein
VKKSLLGVRLSARYNRDPENAGGGGGTSTGGEAGVGGDEDTDDEEGGEGEDEDDEGSAKPKTVSEAKYLQLRKHLSEADRKKQEALNELKALKEKDLPELDKIKGELETTAKERDSYRGRFENLARTNAFLMASDDLKVKWANSAAALRLADLEDLEISDDGKTVDGIKDVVKNLAKEHPYLVAKATDGDEKETAPTKSGSVVGSKKTGTKKDETPSDEELKRLYPALRT